MEKPQNAPQISVLLSHQFAFSQDLGRLLAFAASIGLNVTMGEVWRTVEQQRIYFDKKQSKTMHSAHMSRLAADLNIFAGGLWLKNHDDYEGLAQYWEALSEFNVAGYYWGWDANHFERQTVKRKVRNSAFL